MKIHLKIEMDNQALCESLILIKSIIPFIHKCKSTYMYMYVL